MKGVKWNEKRNEGEEEKEGTKDNEGRNGGKRKERK